MWALGTMKIQATRQEYIPAWVNPEVLEKLWIFNPNYYIKSWSGSPKIGWFAYDIPDVRTGFCTGDMYLEEIDGHLTVGFVAGRHRTRWLMTRGDPLIPVGLEEHHYQKALSIGLAVSRVLAHEELNA